MVSQIGSSSGVSGLGCAEVSPRARSLPARTNSIDGGEIVEEVLGHAGDQVLQGRRGAAIGDVLGLGAGELEEPGTDRCGDWPVPEEA